MSSTQNAPDIFVALEREGHIRHLFPAGYTEKGFHASRAASKESRGQEYMLVRDNGLPGQGDQYRERITLSPTEGNYIPTLDVFVDPFTRAVIEVRKYDHTNLGDSPVMLRRTVKSSTTGESGLEGYCGIHPLVQVEEGEKSRWAPLASVDHNLMGMADLDEVERLYQEGITTATRVLQDLGIHDLVKGVDVTVKDYRQVN